MVPVILSCPLTAANQIENLTVKELYLTILFNRSAITFGPFHVGLDATYYQGIYYHVPSSFI